MVYQGERGMAHDNKLLGHFQLTGIKAAPRGTPRIEVTFNIDVNGIVKVSAKDLDSQKEQEITISGSNGLSKDEIDRMVREAEANKEEDSKRKEEVELKNKAESYISSIDQALREKGDSIDAKQKEETTKLRDELKTALDNNDINTLRNKIGDLEKAAAFMQQQAANGGAQGGNPFEGQQTTENTSTNESKTSNDDVIDADFTDKK